METNMGPGVFNTLLQLISGYAVNITVLFFSWNLAFQDPVWTPKARVVKEILKEKSNRRSNLLYELPIYSLNECLKTHLA